MQEHPLVMKDRVALFGLSFGVSVALTLVAYSKVISVSLAPTLLFFLQFGALYL